MTITIAVDARPLCSPLTGIGHYVNEILRKLSVDGRFRFILYCAPRPPVVTLDRSWETRTSNLPRQVTSRLIFGRWAAADKAEVFWATQTLAPSMTPGVVSTVHDLNCLLAPQTMSWGTALAHKLWFERDIKSADRVVVNSQGTSDRLARAFGKHANAVAIPGVAPRFTPAACSDSSSLKAKYDLPDSYLVAVGTLEPRKNIPILLEAHTALYSNGLAPELVLVGRAGWKMDRSSLVRVGTRVLGYVPDHELPALYAGAAALVIPSMYEGYGMPAAEARACGCPVIATDIPELRESAGPDAVFIEPTMDGIAQGILRALQAPRPRPTDPQRWDQTADVYGELFAELASARRACP